MDSGFTIVFALLIVGMIAIGIVDRVNDKKECPAPPAFVCDGGAIVKQKSADGSIVFRCTIKP